MTNKIIQYGFISLALFGHVYLWTIYTTDIFPPKKELSGEIAIFLIILYGSFLLFGQHRRLRVRKVLGKLIVSSICGILVGYSLNLFQDYNNEKVAEQLIKRLETYKRHKGQYPTSLTDMVPTYYKDYPYVSYGLTNKTFGYSVEQDSYSDYVLFMDLPNGKFKKISSVDKIWEIVKRPFRL